ncbi:MAG: molecular chaperone HtpG [Clostridia bacterium]|nr:molecular chaperone HtpG [Clostridia bacterium]
MSENIKKGGISVDAEHLFPIIKKWLYSDKDIFLREIVSNASDAITKLKRLDSLGEISLPEQDYRIDVVLDKTAGTLTVSDNGIGMSEEELEKYICSIALSGAVEFIQKYEKDETGKPQEGIIGHFGLGFYSSFMVSDTVTVETKSYTDAPAVKWVCDSEGEYETFKSDRTERGTSVIMKISEDESELLSDYKIKEILEKYCSFMPVPVFYSNADDIDKEGEDKKEPEQINDTTPLWMKAPSECSEDDYKAFYKKVFGDFKDPLFWVHINAEYPLNFKGIIYFPKLNSDFDPIEGQVKLYYNQVFVADNIKEVIPEYLLMLRGVLDCPELPLNVSRSYLQNNGYVTKIASHIVKKVADKLNGMMNTDRENYEKIYKDIKVFVEYGCIRDKKFYDRVKGSILFPSVINGKMMTVDEYLDTAKEKHENTVYYATDKKTQAQYISMYENEGAEVLLLDRTLDTQFIQTIEMDREGVKFMRVDSDVADVLKNGEAEENADITALFKEVSGNGELEVSYTALKDEKTPAILNEDEQGRRFSDLMKFYRMGEGEDMPGNVKLVVNTSSALYKKAEELVSADKKDEAKDLCKHVYSLATLAHRQLSSDEMKAFLGDAYELLLKL